MRTNEQRNEFGKSRPLPSLDSITLEIINYIYNKFLVGIVVHILREERKLEQKNAKMGKILVR